MAATGRVGALKMVQGLYVHIPFCPQICPYCAFASLRGEDHMHERYIDAVCREIETNVSLRAEAPLRTVFFGGGTPSQVDPSLLGRVLEAIEQTFTIAVDAEITVEANPGTVDCKKFAHLLQIGVNRLSLGVQSFDDATLKCLGRVHGAAEAERAYFSARAAGFDNTSIDLIFSVPGVTEETWRASVEKAVELAPEHISAYALSIEEGTLFARRHSEGRLIPLGEEEDAQQYEWTRARLLRAGYEQYEVSNYSRPGLYSRHNWSYWSGAEYLGVGLSAHSYVGGRRFWNTRELYEYVECIEAGLSCEDGREEIDEITAQRERYWLGLRTYRGVELLAVEAAILAASERFSQLVEAGHLYIAAGRLLLEPAALVLADALAVEVTDILEANARVGREEKRA
ncbi:MAG: radical SAM family heme chaperone HemW [Candidatus Latescibacterota bacterium]